MMNMIIDEANEIRDVEDDRLNQDAVEREREFNIFCDSLLVGLFLATPYKSCDDKGRPSVYAINYREWVLVYLLINILWNSKFYLD